MLNLLFGLEPQYRRRVLLAYAASLLGIWLLVGDYDRFTVYRNYSAMTTRQDRLGYAFAGRFGRLEWPAVVVDRSDGDKGISFTLPSGQRHQYDRFPGHMKVLTLRSVSGKTFTLVYSEKMKISDRPAGLKKR